LHFDARPITPSVGQEVTFVSDLMTEAGQWDEDVIRAIFLPIDARAILRIPVRLQEEDWWAWEPEKHGEYTVKSAYSKIATTQDSHASTSGDNSWKRIWKLQVPPKVKVFWWRVLHEFIPTKDVLNRRHIEPTRFCDICGAESETIKHTLTECTIARLFWQEMRALTGTKLPQLHPHTWASDLLLPDFCAERDRSVFCIGMYALWLQRNKHRHGVDRLPIKKLVQWTVDTAHDLFLLSNVARPKSNQTIWRWKKPPVGWIKCNIDGAFYADMGQGATGVVIRDSAGTFIGGRALWYRHGLNALMMEAVACRDGVILAREMNFRRVQVETDSQELVNLWEMGELQRSSISPIIKDIKDISVFFLDFSLMYANRACNHVAHTLAKQVSDGNRTGEWLLAPLINTSSKSQKKNIADWLILRLTPSIFAYPL
jgi:hypothetical protein